MAETLDMAALAREHEAWLGEILAANTDFPERLQQLSVVIDYDDELDSLCFQFGPPTEALIESLDELVYVRVVPETLKIVGLEILHARAALAQDPRLLGMFLHPAAAATAQHPGQAQAHLAQDIRALVAV